MRFWFITCIVILNSFIHARDYNILDYGAKGDGVTLNTERIQAAIDEAHKDGGRVVIPGGCYLTGSLILRSNVELHVMKGGILLGSTDPSHYRKINRFLSLILADGQTNVSITGWGEIDGQGRALALHIDSLFYAGKIDSALYEFAEKRPSYYLRPHLVEFVRCSHILIKHITLKNAAFWVQVHDQCENIIIDSMRTESDAYWNNDGIDIQDCRNVRITNCYVNAADDGICLKSQSAAHLCDSIYIAHCTIRSSASAVKFGTVSHGGFRNVVIEHIKVFDTFRSAVAIECVDGGILQDIFIDNIQAVNTGNALFIRLGKRTKIRPAGLLKNVTISNMRVEVAFERPDYAYDIRGPELPFFHNTFPSSITGIPGHPVENVTLENIEIIYPGRGNNGLANLPLSRLDDIPEKEADYPEYSMFGELPAWGFYVRHMDGLTMKNIKLSIAQPDYRPSLVFDDVKNLNIRELTITGDEKPVHIVLKNTENISLDSQHATIKL